jgi:hypothetical protein
MGTIKQSSGKWYWEMTLSAGNRCMLGITKYNTFNSANAFYYSPDVYVYFSSNGNKWNNNTQTAYGASFVQGDVIGVALDLDAGTLVFYKNGVSQGTAFSSLSGNFAPVWGTDTTGNTHVANFGQRQWAYAAPAGFKALCDTNLPAPVVAKPNTVMDVKLYTGNGSTQTISGLNFSPDFVWIKQRDTTRNHVLYDTVRGATKALLSSTTDSEQTYSTSLTAFNSDGFALGSDDKSNGSSGSYAAWTWDAGSSTVTNTQGSITSQVRANPSAGFSVVTFTGTGSALTVGHGLGVAPRVYCVKKRSSTSDWAWFTTAIDGSVDFLFLNTTAAKTDAGGDYATAPTSTVFSLGSASSSINDNGGTYVAYCFAPVAGYSAFGSYVGNGSSDGVFQWCGFRPRWLMIKDTTGSSNYWWIFDTARDTYNASGNYLFANVSDSEQDYRSVYPIDILSNGFKVRNTLVSTNNSVFIYAAFAESPFAYSRAR